MTTPEQSRESQAEKFDTIERELKVAAEHARITAIHYRNGEVARAGAHQFAMQGHLHNAQDQHNEAAKVHASKARTQI